MEIPFYILYILPSICLVKASNTYIEVIISSLVTTDVIGELRVIWETRDFVLGDRIVLYKSGEAVFEHEPLTCSGSIDTNLYIGDINFTQSMTSYCTIYSAGYLHNNETVAYACLQNSPTWMSDIRSYIENFSLPELFIPGTHDSAAYVVSNTGYHENILQKYVYSQDISVYEQLMMGVRYIDISIGYYNHTLLGFSDWWCNHNFMPVQPLKNIFRQIKQFITNTNEIVIIDVHRFPVGFSDAENHMKLAKYISKEMGDLIHLRTNRGYKESLKSIWDSQKRIILSYNKIEIADHFSFFEPIEQYWGIKQALPDLYSYLNGLVLDCDESRETMLAAMAVLTPSTIGVLTDWYGGLRMMAQRINTNITLSYKTCEDWSMCSNIVAVDFIRSTGLVSTAVQTNKAKAMARNRG